MMYPKTIFVPTVVLDDFQTKLGAENVTMEDVWLAENFSTVAPSEQGGSAVPSSPLKAGLMAGMCALIIFGNIFNVSVILYNENLRNVTGSFMVALACADLGLGLLVLPLSVRTSLAGHWVYPESVCQYCGFLGTTFMVASVLLLFDLSVDRYISIAKPIEYNNIMTGKKCKVMIFASWTVAAIYSAGPLYGWGSYEYSYKMYVCAVDIFSEVVFGLFAFIILLPPLFVMCYLNGKIFMIARSQAVQIQNAHVFPQAPNMFPVMSFKAAMTVGIVVVTFAVSWLPMLIAYMYSKFSGYKIPPNLSFAFMYLAVSNSFWNCVIYSTTNVRFRTGAKKLAVRIRQSILQTMER
ncbi:trace amine-associated receptor 9-like [Branchiostoma floridae x Branchiostoma belcheri]